LFCADQALQIALAEAEKAKAEAEKAKAEAERAKAEAEKAKAETEIEGNQRLRYFLLCLALSSLSLLTGAFLCFSFFSPFVLLVFHMQPPPSCTPIPPISEKS
jgi:hypothetical protein